MTKYVRKPLVHYAIVVAVVTAFVLLVGSGVRALPSLLIIPLEKEFGWDRAGISLAISINLLLFGLLGPFGAAMAKRIGARSVMVGALVLLVVAQTATTQIHSLWQLQMLWGVAVGIGSGLLCGWVSATVANTWFEKRRGLVLGLLQASNSTGTLIFMPVLASVLVAIDWRAAVLLVVAVTLVVATVVARFFRDHPSQVGTQPFGAERVSSLAQPTAVTVKINPFTAPFTRLSSDINDRRFLLLAGTFAICGATTMGMIDTHFVAASMERGIPAVTAAGMVGMMGVLDIVGTIGSGWLSDRLDNRWLLVWYFGLRALSLLLLPIAFASGYIALSVFVVFYGLDLVATAPPTVRLLADSFGRENVGVVFAWVMVAHQLGAGAMAFGAGLLRMWLGDYTVALILAGTLALTASALLIAFGGTFRRVPVAQLVPARAN